MKTLISIIILILFIVPNVMAAGSASSSPAVSKDVKIYNKGVKLMLDKKFAKAEKQFRKALEINERFAEAHNNLGGLLAAAGRLKDAIRHFMQALRIEPDNERARHNLELALRQMGKFSDAKPGTSIEGHRSLQPTGNGGMKE